MRAILHEGYPLPPPSGSLGRANVWLRADVEQWMRDHPQRPRRLMDISERGPQVVAFVRQRGPAR